MSALAKRIITAAIFIPLVVVMVLTLPTVQFAFAIAAVAAVGAWEWALLAGCAQPRRRVAYMVAVMGLLYGAYLGLISPAGVFGLLAIACVWWLIALLWVLRYQQGVAPRAMSQQLVRLIAGCLVLVPAWAALVYLHGRGERGPSLVLFLLILTWSADIGAYFAGRRWGNARLASRVSPGKTWEGVLGGLLPVMGIALVGGIVAGMDEPFLMLFVCLCLLTAAVSVLGDLAESMFKRRANLKDSGSLLPGHGGLLDRIDSLTAAAPVFALGVLLLGTGI